jgi:hypothetical protein
MSASAHLLREIIDLCKLIAVPATGLALLATLYFKRSPRPLPKTPWNIAAMLVLASCFLTYAVGTGSCVLGGAIEGKAICSLKPRGRPPLHPVSNFLELQITYLVPFLLTFIMCLSVLLWFIPGSATPWQRLVFLATGGHRGKWR